MQTNEEAYKNFLEIHESLKNAEVPLDRRVMYYYVISWWRHPIKRYRQKKNIKRLVAADV